MRRLGEVCSFFIPITSQLDGFWFIFLLHDSENDLLIQFWGQSYILKSTKKNYKKIAKFSTFEF